MRGMVYWKTMNTEVQIVKKFSNAKKQSALHVMVLAKENKQTLEQMHTSELTI